MKPFRMFLPAAVVAATLALAPAQSWAKEPVTKSTVATESSDLNLARSVNRAFIELAERVAPSVVVISVQTKDDPRSAVVQQHLEWLPEQFRRQFQERLAPPSPDDDEDSADQPKQKQKREARPHFNGEGSGIVFRDEGYILTNNHVVENAEKIRVRLKDGREFEAEVRGLDPESDLAVIKLKGEVKDLAVAKFANSDQIRVGEFAIAIGAPFHLDYSVTFGHISAKGRENIAPTQMWDQQFLQTDARINPGNSGGPLVNIDGEVVGVNSMIRGMESGIGFAIPSNLAVEVAERLIADGKFTRSWLGISIQTLKEAPDVKDLGEKIKDGVLVREIRKDGPAARSTLEAFDVITAVDGKPVANVQALRNEVSRKRPNSDVELSVYRSGERMTVKVRAEALPESSFAMNRGSRAPAAPKAPAKVETLYLDNLGLEVEPISKNLAREHQLDPQTRGVFVESVKDGSLADTYGVKPGDVIYRAAEKPVTSPQELNDALAEAGSAGRARIGILRDGNRTGLLLKKLPKQ